MSDWIHACYTDIDAMDLPAVLDRFSADGEIVFGNNPPAVGHTAIGELLTGFWSTIAGMRHEWRHRWTVDETTAVLETRVHYTTHAGTDVTVPCVTVCERTDSDLITSLRVYLDPAPLFERIGAEATATAQAAR